jgi:large subunit ribosomal protein L24
VKVNLSKELRQKQGKRNMQVKQGDTVRVMRGKFKGKKGKVQNVSLKDSRLTVEGIQVKKQDGSNANVKMRPSNLQITELGERVKKGEEKDKKPESNKTTKKSESKSTKKSYSNEKQHNNQGGNG